MSEKISFCENWKKFITQNFTFFDRLKTKDTGNRQIIVSLYFYNWYFMAGNNISIGVDTYKIILPVASIFDDKSAIAYRWLISLLLQS